MANKKYTVKNTNLLHNGKTYKIGDVIELDEEKGKKLADILIPIEENADTSTKTNTKTSTAAKTKTSAKAKTEAETTVETDDTNTTQNESTDGTAPEDTTNTDASTADGGDK